MNFKACSVINTESAQRLQRLKHCDYVMTLCNDATYPNKSVFSLKSVMKRNTTQLKIHGTLLQESLKAGEF